MWRVTIVRFRKSGRKTSRPITPRFQAGLAAVMPAHVIFSQCDAEPAGYSKYWLREILRGKLAFQGVVFSDDAFHGRRQHRRRSLPGARAALAAGCDMVLLCNDPRGTRTCFSTPSRTFRRRMRNVSIECERKAGATYEKGVAYREAQQSLTALA